MMIFGTFERKRIMQKLIDDVAEKLDKQLDFKKLVSGIKGIAIEWFDGPAIKSALTFVQAKLPEEAQDEFKMLLTAYLNDNYEGVQFEAIGRLNAWVNIPLLDEEDEADLFKSVFGWFGRVIARRKLKSQNGGSFDDPGQGPPDKDPD